MIIKENKIYFIDFGLSFFSSRIEDRAVDLHLVKEALQSTHHEYYELHPQGRVMASLSAL